jgi:cytochrome P450
MDVDVPPSDHARAPNSQQFPPPEHYEDPYPFYRELRERSPVYRVPGTDTYVLMRWEDQVWAARQPELFASSQPFEQHGFTSTGPGQRYETRPPLSETDPPAHTTLRKAIYRLFTPGRLESYEPMIERETTALIDAFGDRTEVDFVHDLAAPLPTRVIGAILGLPSEIYPQLKTWSDDLLEFLVPNHTPEVEERLLASAAEFLNYCGDQVACRRQRPLADNLTELALARKPDGQLYELDDMVANVRQLILGGNETTTYMMTHVLRDVLEHPEHVAHMRDRQHVLRLVDESLRLESVASNSIRRTTRDVELGGVTIPANSRIVLQWSSGNRDARAFEDPEHFDPSRSNLKKQLGFGHGKHFCVGAPLARLEAVVVFRTLFTRFGTIRMARDNEFRQVPNYPRLRALSSLRIKLDPA